MCLTQSATIRLSTTQLHICLLLYFLYLMFMGNYLRAIEKKVHLHYSFGVFPWCHRCVSSSFMLKAFSKWALETHTPIEHITRITTTTNIQMRNEQQKIEQKNRLFESSCAFYFAVSLGSMGKYISGGWYVDNMKWENYFFLVSSKQDDAALILSSLLYLPCARSASARYYFECRVNEWNQHDNKLYRKENAHRFISYWLKIHLKNEEEDKWYDNDADFV